MKKDKYTILKLMTAIMVCTISACSTPKTEQIEKGNSSPDLYIEVRETSIGGRDAKVFHLSNSNGMEVEISSFGGIISKLIVPDREGKPDNIVLRYNDIADYDNNDTYFGAAIGRFGNRIAKGEFELNGESYQLATNDGANHLHGGIIGFHRVIWDSEYVVNEHSVKLVLSYTSPDGEEGYPGNLKTTLSFELTQDNKLLLEFAAETDKPTIVNLTHHGYFNLSGMQENILGHQLTLNAPNFTPVGPGLIPTGEIKAVADTPFDFTKPHEIGERIAEVMGGYDHNFVVKGAHSAELVNMAELYHSGTGRVMTLFADSPAVQFYSGNFLNGKITVDGITYTKHMGLCLEPQTFPNAPNEPSFPTATLNPGEKYSHRIQYHFSTK